MKYIVVHTTTDSEELANKIAREVVTRRLAACVQIVPIRSVYRWQGNVEFASEFRCELKTHTNRIVALRALIHELHTYDVPEVVEFVMQNLSAGYQSWLDDQLRED